MVRYVFFQKEHAYFSPRLEDTEARRRAHTSLSWATKSAMWRVRAYRNPNDQDTHGQYWMSVNLEARTPYLGKDGQPVTVWEKDEHGKRVGDAPKPLTAKHSVIVEDGSLQIRPV